MAAVSSARATNASGADVCGFDESEATCHFALWISVLGFLFSLSFIVMEAQWERLASYHRYIYLGELVASGSWTVLYFVTFCALASNWKGEIKDQTSHASGNMAIAFSFFSTLSWSALAYFSYKGYKEDDLVGLGGMERLGNYMDPVTAAYHQGGSGGGNVV